MLQDDFKKLSKAGWTATRRVLIDCYGADLLLQNTFKKLLKPECLRIRIRIVYW